MTSDSSSARCASATNDPRLLIRHVPCVAEALEARSSSDHRELARMARQVAAARA